MNKKVRGEIMYVAGLYAAGTYDVRVIRDRNVRTGSPWLSIISIIADFGTRYQVPVAIIFSYHYDIIIHLQGRSGKTRFLFRILVS